MEGHQGLVDVPHVVLRREFLDSLAVVAEVIGPDEERDQLPVVLEIDGGVGLHLLDQPFCLVGYVT